MRHFAVAILLITCSFLGHSQTYEIGGFLGGSNFIGDVGKTTYIAPNRVAFGGIFKWNRSARHSFRGSIMITELHGDDAESPEERRKQRDYSFNSSILELSAGIEFTFWEFNLHSGYPQTTPYLYTGITYFSFDSPYNRGDILSNYDRNRNFAIPMVLGIKTSIGTRFVLGFEIGARYTFTDGIDGSVPAGNLADEEDLYFGNINSNDWYVFTGFTLTVSFGRKPCYCNF